VRCVCSAKPFGIKFESRLAVILAPVRERAIPVQHGLHGLPTWFPFGSGDQQHALPVRVNIPHPARVAAGKRAPMNRHVSAASHYCGPEVVLRNAGFSSGLYIALLSRRKLTILRLVDQLPGTLQLHLRANGPGFELRSPLPMPH